MGVYTGSSGMVFPSSLELACLEALACRKAQALPRDPMLQNAVILCDSKGVVEDIQNDSEGRHEMIIVENISNNQFFNSWKFIFESRATDREANSLKFATSLLPGSDMWLSNPHDHVCTPLNLQSAKYSVPYP